MSSEPSDFDVKALIASSWDTGLGGFEARRPDLTMSSFIDVTDHANDSVIPTTVVKWLALYDEIGVFFISLAILMQSTDMDDLVEGTTFRASMLCLSGMISAQIVALRHLVTSGLDVQAKQLLRALTELVDLASVISIDPSISESFSRTVDEDTANQFWHHHAKKGKLRKTVFKRLEESVVKIPAAELMDYINQEQKLLGMCVHPSMAAAQMACLPLTGVNPQPFHFGFLGRATIFSERTLSHAIVYLSFYIAVGYAPIYESIDYSSRKESFPEVLQEYVSRGQTALLRLVLALMPKLKHPALRCDADPILAELYSAENK